MRKTFYETGEIYIIKQWNEGVEEGKFYQYYINGKLSVKAKNKEGTLDGVYISYNPDGSIFFEGYYENGIRRS